MTTLSDLHTRLRIELGDVAEVVWVDASIDAALVRAIREFSQYEPQELTADLDTDGTTRDISLSSLAASLLTIYGVEYPVDEYPPAYVKWQRFGALLTLHVDAIPEAGTGTVKLYYGGLHAVSSTMTLEAEHEDVVLDGAAAYAYLEKGAATLNVGNIGGSGVPVTYEAHGRRRLDAWHDRLRRMPAARRLRSSTLYVPGRAAGSGDSNIVEPIG